MSDGDYTESGWWIIAIIILIAATEIAFFMEFVL